MYIHNTYAYIHTYICIFIKTVPFYHFSHTDRIFLVSSLCFRIIFFVPFLMLVYFSSVSVLFSLFVFVAPSSPIELLVA